MEHIDLFTLDVTLCINMKFSAWHFIPYDYVLGHIHRFC